MQTALKRLQPEASTVHISPFNRMENERLRIRVHRNVENAETRPKPLVDMYPLLNQVAHASRKTIRCTPQATPIHQGLKDTRAKAKSRFPSANNTRRHSNVEQEFFHKPPRLTGSTRAQESNTSGLLCVVCCVLCVVCCCCCSVTYERVCMCTSPQACKLQAY